MLDRHLLNPLTDDRNALFDLFEKIFHKNAIAFLGAGASVTNKQLLSSDIIDSYEAKISKNFGTIDVIKFVDIMQNTSGLHRNDFDRFVVDALRTLKPEKAHEILSTIPWKMIFTTNYDTLIEDSFASSLNKGLTANK